MTPLTSLGVIIRPQDKDELIVWDGIGDGGEAVGIGIGKSGVLNTVEFIWDDGGEAIGVDIEGGAELPNKYVVSILEPEARKLCNSEIFRMTDKNILRRII